MQYLRGTTTLGIQFMISSNMLLCGWMDADYGSSQVTKQSTSGYVITFCANPISWTTKKQSFVAQSTMEAEFMAINKCTKQLCWMSNLLTLLAINIEILIIFNNNLGAVVISKEPKLNPNIKHIKIRFQNIWKLMNNKVMKIKQV
jgi:hypothetical protein